MPAADSPPDPSTRPAWRALRDPRQVWRVIVGLILLVVAWRLLMAGLLPATQDEAYYFDWARSLAWGYFDHPPGVALLGATTWLAPGSALAARLGGVLAGLLTLLVLARLYWNAGLRDRPVLGLALVLAAASLPALAGGFLLTPDTPLALAWALALHESERALAGQRRRWLSAGIATGLGLLGKYTMVVIGPVFLWAILRSDPRVLRTPWPYLGGLLALLVFAPNLIWNAENDWLTLRFQLGHGFALDSGALFDPAQTGGEGGVIEHSGPRTPLERAGSLLGYLGTQLGFWGLLALPILALPWLARRGERSALGTLAPHARPLLVAATLFPLGFFALVSLTSDVEANWPAMYLLAAPALLAPLFGPIRTWVLGAAGANLLLVSLYALHGATAALPLPESQNRILRETHGFQALAERVAGLDGPVYATRYQDTAMLRLYGGDRAISQWPGIGRPSEYLRGRIAPRVEPDTIDVPFWLVTRRWMPPEIAGFRAGEPIRLFDCTGMPLAEADAPPCRRPLHLWGLVRYVPVGVPVGVADALPDPGSQ